MGANHDRGNDSNSLVGQKATVFLMKPPSENELGKSAARLLAALAAGLSAASDDDAAALIAADLAIRLPGGQLAITEAGRAHLRRGALARGGLDPFLGQHLAFALRIAETPGGPSRVTIDEAESPLMWLARRKARDGRAFIEPHQLQAGERLRAEFTGALLMPRTTSNWEAPISRGRRAGGASTAFGDAVVATRQRLNRALDAVGPEFSGLLLDICCFLKRLEDIERERRWPPRSAKVVLQLALDRLARHYGYGAQARGKPHAALQSWAAPDTAVVADAE